MSEPRPSGTRPWPAILIAGALLVALGPAAAAGRDHGAALRPEQIRIVQRALQEHGLWVEVTGAWDEPTRAALAQLQEGRGLPSTGRLDAATAEALGLDPAVLLPVRGGDRRTAAARDPMYNCEIYNTIDCDPGGGG